MIAHRGNIEMTKQNVMMVSDTEAVAINLATAMKPPVGPGGYPTVSMKMLQNLEINNGGTSVRVNAWVDSMKASSPTHISSTSPSLDHSSWILRHPSALEMFEQITIASKGKQIVMFLDYDGTLSPIVDDPDRAYMSKAMRTTVRKLAKCFPSAIVSGRCRDKVFNFVRLAELYYAGSHGMDIRGPSKVSKEKNSGAHSVLCQPASDFLPMINEVYKALLETTKSTPGAKVENNKFCVSVHFRRVDEKEWGELFQQVRYVTEDYPMLRLTQGRKVLEIRPTIKWDKGKALEFLLESLGYAKRNDVFPIYIGDDRTDEDAFKVLRERGQGLGILVSKIPKETNASYYLQEPSEVMDFLQRLVHWKRMLVRKQLRVRKGLGDVTLPN